MTFSLYDKPEWCNSLESNKKNTLEMKTQKKLHFGKSIWALSRFFLIFEYLKNMKIWSHFY